MMMIAATHLVLIDVLPESHIIIPLSLRNATKIRFWCFSSNDKIISSTPQNRLELVGERWMKGGAREAWAEEEAAIAEAKNM